MKSMNTSFQCDEMSHLIIHCREGTERRKVRFDVDDDDEEDEEELEEESDQVSMLFIEMKVHLFRFQESDQEEFGKKDLIDDQMDQIDLFQVHPGRKISRRNSP